jgi:hypothetical protein
LAARTDCGGVDPVFSVEPAADVGWVIKSLPHARHASEHAGLKGRDIYAEVLAKADMKMNGAFDHIATIGRMEKEAAFKKRSSLGRVG